MPYNFVHDSFHIKELCSRLSSSEMLFYTENGRVAFLAPFGGLGVSPLWGLRGNVGSLEGALSTSF